MNSKQYEFKITNNFNVGITAKLLSLIGLPISFIYMRYMLCFPHEWKRSMAETHPFICLCHIKILLFSQISRVSYITELFIVKTECVLRGLNFFWMLCSSLIKILSSWKEKNNFTLSYQCHILFKNEFICLCSYYCIVNRCNSYGGKWYVKI